MRRRVSGVPRALSERVSESARKARRRREEGRAVKRMREPVAGGEGGKGAPQTPLGGFVATLVKGLNEVLAIVREMLSIVATVSLGVAERIGQAELVVWRRAVVPAARAVANGALAALRFGEREVTPVRATAAVTIVALIVLAASQFVDYREVRAGVPSYAGVDSVAPAPQVEGTVHDAGDAHAFVMLPLAALGLVAVFAALGGRWRIARMLVPIGLAVIAVSLLVDVPKGLDEGVLEVQFEGAQARLLAGFWSQLFAGVVLVVTGPLLSLQLDPNRRARKMPTRARRRGPRFDRLARRLPFGRSTAEGTSA